MEQERLREERLLRAVKIVALGEVRQLVTDGVSVDCRDPSTGWTPLMLAARRRHFTYRRANVHDMVDLLLELGADVNATDFGGQTALAVAMKSHAWDVVQQLIEVGAIVNAAVTDEALIEAVVRSSPVQVVQWLFSTRSASIDSVLTSGETLLTFSARNSGLDTVRALVQAGAMVNAVSRDGSTALIAASERNARDIVRFLLESGADANSVLESGDTLLVHAAGRGALDIVRALIEGGAVANAPSANGRIAVAAAAEKKAWSVVQLLLQHRADANAVLESGDTLLVHAARLGISATVEDLVNSGAAVETLSRDGTSAVMAAVQSEAWAVVQFLLEHGADANTVLGDGSLLLGREARRGHLKNVQMLVQCGAAVNATSRDGTSAVMAAARSGAGSVVKYFLFECGADVTSLHENRASFLAESIRHGDLETVQALVRGGALINTASESATRAVMEAAPSTIETEATIVRFLLENGADENAMLDDGSTVLVDAAARGKLATVQVLVQGGAVMDARSRDGTTAIMAAVQSEQWAVARFLLQIGADANAILETGETMLACAARRSDLETVEVFIQRGAAVRATSQDGLTAVLAAATVGKGGTVRLLVENGADVNTMLESGESLLAFVAKNGGLVTVRTLVQAGALVNAASRSGMTAVAAAAQSNEWPVVEFLLENGADANTFLQSGESLLERATKHGVWVIVGLILKSGAKINAERHIFQHVLWNAALSDQFNVVRPCVDNGADPNAVRIEDGDSVLVYAVKRASWRTAMSLIDCGSDVNATDKCGRTVMMHAAMSGGLGVVQHLIDSRADPAAVDPDGHTAFYLAAINGHRAVQQLLMPYTLQSELEDDKLTSQATVISSPDSSLQTWFISPFEISLQEYTDAQNVGGEFRAKWLNADVVIKLFVPIASSTSFAEEVMVWHQLRHPNVIKLYGACDLGHHFFVCEYASNGSLVDYLAACARTGARSTPWKFLQEAALGLSYLHERGIVHGNLRGSNILIGADGLAKLAEFGLTESAKAHHDGKGSESLLGYKRWQSPERLWGEQASFASDIYSFGLCVVEALTGKAPWAGEDEKQLIYAKEYWIPASETSPYAPATLTNELRDLASRLCAWDPEKRVTASSLVQILENLAAQEAGKPELSQPEPEPLLYAEWFENGEIAKMWGEVHRLMEQSGVSDLQQCAFQQLDVIHKRICGACWPRKTLFQYQGLLSEFITAMQPNSHQNRILHLSSTRAIGSNMHLIERRIDAMWTLLDDAPKSFQERKRLWKEQRSKQLELFVSEVSDTLLSVGSLESEEDRSALLALLESEINAPGPGYTRYQLSVLKKAYAAVTKGVSHSVVKTVPPWFLPWYELKVDTSTCLGSGSFGCVYLAKWLDSEVVVKQVKKLESRAATIWSMPTMSSDVGSAVSNDPEAKAERQKTRRMFEREVAVWFGLSHPHVVRLFGACHVGIPFFACEYASNGSLDKYLRKHPTELWTKLYEAALGVQYLHARRITHGDLKCNNIVVGSDGKGKVTDFGLSSEIEHNDAEMTGAVQWVAPECLKDGALMRSFASDVFALGMCVVEALRVVVAVTMKKDERKHASTPWGNIKAVTYKVLNGELPPRPELCLDAEWKLVQRMCAFKPAQRIKISTVVDELAVLASVNVLDSSEEKPPAFPESISSIVAAMNGASFAAGGAQQRTYGLLWSRLEHMTSVISSSDLELLRPIVDQARDSTRQLRDSPLSSVTETKLIEATFQGYDLHRRLDKLIDANFWFADGDSGEVHKWQAACESFVRETDERKDPSSPSGL